MTESDKNQQPRAVQQSLFPDESELLGMAMSTLRDLDVPRARMFLERIRQQNPQAVNVDFIHRALGLLEEVLGRRALPAAPAPSDVVEVMARAQSEGLSGRIARPVAEFVDETLARYWQRHGSPAEFVDDAARLHRGVFDLIRGDAVAARRYLDASLHGGHHLRADLWGYRGDVACVLQRTGEESGCYVRALLLSAADVDLFRCRMTALVRTFAQLCRRYPEDCARELLLIHAWLDGSLSIPAQNGWLDERDLGGPVGLDSPPRQRYQRFARLLYMDRSLPPGCVGIERRDEMMALGADLFRQYMDRCRALEDGT